MTFAAPESLTEFYDRLAASIFPGPVPEDFVAFRAEAEARHVAGEDVFGDQYLRRDNKPEGREEAADLGNYALYDHLQYLAGVGTEDDELALVLTAAKHGYLAHKAFQELAAKRNGSP